MTCRELSARPRDGFCQTLCRDGIIYGNEIERITYLPFLKMAEERGIGIPNHHD